MSILANPSKVGPGVNKSVASILPRRCLFSVVIGPLVTRACSKHSKMFCSRMPYVELEGAMSVPLSGRDSSWNIGGVKPRVRHTSIWAYLKNLSPSHGLISDKSASRSTASWRAFHSHSDPCRLRRALAPQTMDSTWSALIKGDEAALSTSLQCRSEYTIRTWSGGTSSFWPTVLGPTDSQPDIIRHTKPSIKPGTVMVECRDNDSDGFIKSL